MSTQKQDTPEVTQILGKLSDLDTALKNTVQKDDIDDIQVKQGELTEALARLEQNQPTSNAAYGGKNTIGEQFVSNDVFRAWKDTRVAGGSLKGFEFTLDIQNAATKSDGQTGAPDHLPGGYGVSQQFLTIEDLLPKGTTTSSSITYSKVTTDTDNAGARAQAAVYGISALQFTKQTLPLENIGSSLVITQELLNDETLLVNYINDRLLYFVSLETEAQLLSGNGTSPNLEGIIGEASAHGIRDAALGANLKKHVLLRTIIANLRNAGKVANAIVLNPSDAASLQIEAGTTDFRGVELGVPIVESSSIAADSLLVGDFNSACQLVERDGLTVRLYDQDKDNASKGLVTLIASRRLALVNYETSISVIKGDLTPA